jgi:L-methionine (R)-S-oxide reductase
LKAEVETLAASDARDEEVLRGVVQLVHDAHPPWEWSGIYLLVNGTLVVGPFAGSDEPPEHSRIEVGDGVCGTAVAEDKNQLVEDVRELDNYLACSLSTRSELVVLIREGVGSSASSTSTATSGGPLRKKTRFCWRRSRP